MIKVLAAVTAICLLLFGCSNKPTAVSELLSKEKMTEVLWEVTEASSFTEQFIKKDSLKDAALEDMKMQQKIFNLHHISKDDFYKSYKFYASRPELMAPILDSIVAKSQRERMKVLEKHAGGRIR